MTRELSWRGRPDNKVVRLISSNTSEWRVWWSNLRLLKMPRVAATTERSIANGYRMCQSTMDGSNDCEYRQNVDRWGNMSGLEARNLRNGFSGVNKENKVWDTWYSVSEFVGCASVAILMWYDAEEMCVPDCIKCIQVRRTYWIEFE